MGFLFISHNILLSRGSISLFNALLDDVEYKREVHTIDNLHPGQKGHDKIFEIIKNERIWWFSPR